MTLEEVRLVPAPRRVVAGQDVLRVKRAFSVRSVEGLPWGCEGFPGRLEAALGSAGLKVKFFEVDQYEEQAYKIEIGRGGVIVCARNVRGLWYGAQTLRQLLAQAGAEIPCGVIEDTPRFGWRCVYLDLRVHKYKTAYLKQVCAELGRLKYSAVLLNYHDTFAFKKEPCVRGDIYISAEHIAELNKAAREAGIELIPYQAVLGAVEQLVELERYRGMRTADGTLDVGNAQAVRVMCGLLDELMAAHDAAVIGLGVPAPHEAGEELSEAAMAYLDALVAHVEKRGKTPLVCVGGGAGMAGWLERMPKNTIVAYTAHDEGGLGQLTSACARNGLRMAGVVHGRAAHDNELCSDRRAAVAQVHAGVAALGRAEVTRAVVALPSGCACVQGARPALSALCGGRLMHVALQWPVLAAAADALWSATPDAARVEAAWPRYWWGLDDTRVNELADVCAADPLRVKHTAEIIKRGKRISKLAAELKPARHAEQLGLYDFYARLAVHAVHVRQTFARTPRLPQVNLLMNELARLKDLHKDVMSETMYRREIVEEQAHLFGHTEMLLGRIKGA